MENLLILYFDLVYGIKIQAMKKIFFLLLVVLMSGSMHAQQNIFSHKVKVGETLYSISQTYGVSVNDIKKQNGGLTDNIVAGQVISIPQSATGEIHHTIQAGETLYSISKRYNVTSKVITDANPGLSASNFKTGTLIVIPRGVYATAAQQAVDVASPKERKGYKSTHVVQKKETVYSICKQYGVAQHELIKANPALKEGKLKKGMTLNIPYPSSERYVLPTDSEVFRVLSDQKSSTRYNAVNVAVILPFGLDAQKRTAESAKMVDFYRGFLMAVDSLKNSGTNVNVYAYDEGASVYTALSQPEMKNMQLIVGPAKAEHIEAVAQYAHNNNIMNVIPMSAKENAVNNHKTSFQVNSPQNYTYSFVYEKFLELNSNVNIIFVAMSDKSDNADYVWGFKKYLTMKNKSFERISFAEMNNVAKHLKKGVKNVFIPSSGSTRAFEMLTAELDNLALSDSYDISLFGYPDWQTFVDKNEKSLDKYKASFYTTFFSDASAHRVASFNYRYRTIFKKAQHASCPKFGELGYDIGAFFVKGLHDYGAAFNENVEKVKYESLQNQFHFVRKNNWSGFENTVVMFIQYKGNDLIEIKRYE